MEGLEKKLSQLHVQYDWDSLFEGDRNDTPPKKSPNRKQKREQVTEGTKLTVKQFAKQKEELSYMYYKEFNECAFSSQLPVDLEITWSKRMLTTAGFTRYKRRPLSGTGVATIELSMKVIDNEDRLQATLLHEMCHVAAFVVDGVLKPPHGACFWKWARVAESRLSHITVNTCHSYDINKPFKFTCTNECCAKVYGRHSKKGIDVNRQSCGLCHSTLEFTGKVNPDGTPVKARAASGFSLFVKEHYSTVKAKESGQSKQSHGDVMKVLSKMYSLDKEKSNKLEDCTSVAKVLF